MAIDLTPGSGLVFPGYETNWGMEQFLYSMQGNDLEFSQKADKIAGDAFGARYKNSLSGMMDGSLKVKGLSTQAKGQLNWQLDQWQGRKSPINAWFALEGMEPLSPITMMPTSIVDNSVTAKLKDAVDFSCELDARGAVDKGVILLSPAHLLTGSSGTGSADLNTNFGGATSSGGVGYLFVWALDGGTSPTVTVTIQHSPDGTSYTPLMAFAAAPAPVVGQAGSQRIKLPSVTTINPYVQATWTASGSPTDVQVLCGFSRGVNLNV